MIEWLKRLWLEEYEVTIWFNKEKLNPFADEKARSKKVFHMKKIQTKIAKEIDRQCTNLSMGMSGDYEVASKAGSTQVRIGTFLYGKR